MEHRVGQIRQTLEYVRVSIAHLSSRTVLEVGMGDGSDTPAILSALHPCNYHAFEPDPRNHAACSGVKGITFHPHALGRFNAIAPFYLSTYTDPAHENCFFSSSLRKPKLHLHRFPDIEFRSHSDVRVETLDSFCLRTDIREIDFIWADIQGSEHDFILGGARMLKHTRLLYTEFYDFEIYDGSIGLDRMKELLETWRVVFAFENDVLLENLLFMKGV